MSLAAIAAAIVLAPTACAVVVEPARATNATILLGDGAIEAQHVSLLAGRFEAFRLRARASGAATGMRLFVDDGTTASAVIVELFHDRGGRPAARLAMSSLTRPQSGVWNTVELAPSQIRSGGFYWLTVRAKGGTLRYRDRRYRRCPNGTGSRASLGAPLRSAAAGRVYHVRCQVSAYALTTSVGPPSAFSGGTTALSPGSPVGTSSTLGSSSSQNPHEPTPPHEPPTESPQERPKEEPREKSKERPAAPVNTQAPAISGASTEGEVLSSTTGGWTGSPTGYTYLWQDCNAAGGACVNASGATSSSHTLGDGDVGHTMRVVVTASNANGSTSASSAQTQIVASASGTAYPACTQTVSQGANVASTLSAAAPGAVVCLNSGAYGALTLNSSHTADVTLQSAPGAHVTTAAVSIGASHIVLRGLWIDGEVALAAGTSFVTLDRNDITGGGEGVVFDTSDCTVPNAPTWPGCEPQQPISDVIISGNHFHDIGQSGSEDAIHLDNWRNVTVSANEFDHIIESGNHTDCLQSVYGGSGLTFTRNYEHDNDCQGFFVKDGDASEVSVTDNLFLRDHEGSYANFAQIWNVQGLSVENNTIWDGKGLALVAENASFTPSATITHNLIATFALEKPTGKAYALSEGYNIFGEAPNGLSAAPTDATNANPQFANTAADDYRLASNPNGIGVDWSPGEETYGPAS